MQVHNILLKSNESDKFEKSKIVDLNNIPGLEETKDNIYCFNLKQYYAPPLINYSLDEKQIGYYQIGAKQYKKLYRKCFKLTSPNIINSTIEILNISNLNIQQVTNITGTINTNDSCLCQINIQTIYTWYRRIAKTLVQLINSTNHQNCSEIIILDYIKSTDYAIPNIDKLKECFMKDQIYSIEEEIVIGKWIDGKPLYQKVIECNTPSSTTATNIFNLSNLNIDTMVDISGTFYADSCDLAVNMYGSEASRCCLYYLKPNKMLRCMLGNYSPLFNRPIKAIIKYTKLE